MWCMHLGRRFGGVATATGPVQNALRRSRAASAGLAKEAPSGLKRSFPPSFQDIAPGSAYLQGLFYSDDDGSQRRPLPEGVEHHLLFGHARHASQPGSSGDKVISTASAARWEAIEDADAVYPLDHDHVGILHSARTKAILQRILDERR